MQFDGECCHFWVADLDAFLVGRIKEGGLDSEPGVSLGVPDAGKHEIQRGRRRASPGLGDFTEQAVLNGIPLGSAWRLVTDGDRQVKGIDQLGLKLLLPKTGTIAIAAAPIGEDQEFWCVRIESDPGVGPPVGNGIHGEFSRIRRESSIDVAWLMLFVIDAVGDSPCQGIGGKVVHVDLGTLFTPDLSGLLKRTDEFFLLGIDADRGPTSQAKDLPLTLQIGELGVPLRMGFGRQAFDIALETDFGVAQQALNRLSPQRMAHLMERTL